MSYRDRRASPRLEVVDQLHGQLVAFNVPLTLRDLGAGGFSVAAPIPFPAGATHLFRFITAAGVEVLIEATVAYVRGGSDARNEPCYVTGFSFAREASAHTAANINVLLDAMLDALQFDDDDPEFAAGPPAAR